MWPIPNWVSHTLTDFDNFGDRTSSGTASLNYPRLIEANFQRANGNLASMYWMNFAKFLSVSKLQNSSIKRSHYKEQVGHEEGFFENWSNFGLVAQKFWIVSISGPFIIKKELLLLRRALVSHLCVIKAGTSAQKSFIVLIQRKKSKKLSRFGSHLPKEVSLSAKLLRVSTSGISFEGIKNEAKSAKLT